MRIVRTGFAFLLAAPVVAQHVQGPKIDLTQDQIDFVDEMRVKWKAKIEANTAFDKHTAQRLCEEWDVLKRAVNCFKVSTKSQPKGHSAAQTWAHQGHLPCPDGKRLIHWTVPDSDARCKKVCFYPEALPGKTVQEPQDCFFAAAIIMHEGGRQLLEGHLKFNADGTLPDDLTPDQIDEHCDYWMGMIDTLTAEGEFFKVLGQDIWSQTNMTVNQKIALQKDCASLGQAIERQLEAAQAKLIEVKKLI